MKIIVVLGPFIAPPPHGAGAVEKIWFQLADELRSLGNQVEIVAKLEEGSAGYISVKGFDRTGNLYHDIILDLIYTLRAVFLKHKADVVISNTFWFPIIYHLMWKLKFIRRPSLYLASIARMPKRGMLFLHSQHQQYHAVSAAVKNSLIKMGRSNSQIHTIPNPVDLNVFKPRETHNKGILTITYAGRIASEKGILELIKAFKAFQKTVPNSLLNFYGTHEIARGGSGKNFLDICKKEGNCSIKFLGELKSPQKLAEALRSSDIFVYPSLSDHGETFGVSALEAMACGIPTLVSDLECFREFVTPNENALIFNHRKNCVKNLTDGLLTLAQDEELRKSISAEAVKTAKYYSYQNVAQMLNKLIKKNGNRDADS